MPMPAIHGQARTITIALHDLLGCATAGAVAPLGDAHALALRLRRVLTAPGLSRAAMRASTTPTRQMSFLIGKALCSPAARLDFTLPTICITHEDNVDPGREDRGGSELS